MVNHELVQLALRTRLLTLAVCTTGAVSLSATSTGYARASGSFIVDGFAVGMEIVASGFGTAGNNGVKVITGVTATAIAVEGGATVEAGASGRSLAAGLPAFRSWDNVEVKPPARRPYVRESYVPATSTLRGMVAGGLLEDTGLYVIKWYGLSNTDVLAIRKAERKVFELFPAGLGVSVSDGSTVRIRGDIAPFSSQITPQGDGWSVCTITLPWRVFTNNPA